MPFASDKQKRFFYARLNSKKKQEDGPSKEVAKKFIEDSGGQVEDTKERFSKIKKKLKKS